MIPLLPVRRLAESGEIRKNGAKGLMVALLLEPEEQVVEGQEQFTPRELSLQTVDGAPRLAQTPVKQLSQLTAGPSLHKEKNARPRRKHSPAGHREGHGHHGLLRCRHCQLLRAESPHRVRPGNPYRL